MPLPTINDFVGVQETRIAHLWLKRRPLSKSRGRRGLSASPRRIYALWIRCTITRHSGGISEVSGQAIDLVVECEVA
jgi:hypothetical protein